MRKNDKGFVRFLSFSLVKGKLYLSIGLTEGRNESTVGRIKTVGTLFSKLCSWWCGEALGDAIATKTPPLRFF